MNKQKTEQRTWKRKIHRVIFGTDTWWGKTFDIILLVAILLSILTVMLESVDSIYQSHGALLKNVEWAFTILFLIEYILRIISSQKPLKYVLSFLGIIDLLAIIPTFLGLIFAGSQALIVLRSIRLIRIFRILKLARYLSEAFVIARALRYSAPKIIVFLVGVVSLTIILGTLMYLFEGSENGFTSIPKSIYWAIVTLTTVGYGDITPQTLLGQITSSVIMILGYGIIAVPTGIVTGEFVQAARTLNTPETGNVPETQTVSGSETLSEPRTSSESGSLSGSGNIPKSGSENRRQICRHCMREGHETDAVYCKYCGEKLDV